MKLLKNIHHWIIENRFYSFIISFFLSIIVIYILRFVELPKFSNLENTPEVFYVILVSSPIALILWMFRDYDRRKANSVIKAKYELLAIRKKLINYKREMSDLYTYLDRDTDGGRHPSQNKILLEAISKLENECLLMIHKEYHKNIFNLDVFPLLSSIHINISCENISCKNITREYLKSYVGTNGPEEILISDLVEDIIPNIEKEIKLLS